MVLAESSTQQVRAPAQEGKDHEMQRLQRQDEFSGHGELLVLRSADFKQASQVLRQVQPGEKLLLSMRQVDDCRRTDHQAGLNS
jgi:hypothetical protein